MAIKHVGNPNRLGELIVRWAANPATRPADVAEFIAQTAAVGADVVLDGGETNLDLADQPESSADTIHVRIPHNNDIVNAKGTLPPGPAEYPLHRDYNDAFVAPTRRDDMSDAELDNYNNMVIGQYTTKKCQ